MLASPEGWQGVADWLVGGLRALTDFFNTTFNDWVVPAQVTNNGDELVYSTPGVSTTSYRELGEIVLEPNADYEVTFAIENYVLGTIRASLGGTLGDNRFAGGTETQIIPAGSANNRIALVSNGNANFSIPAASVSVVKV